MDIRRRPPNPSVKVANLEYAIPHEEGQPRNILEEIIWEKDREVQIARNRVPIEKLKEQISILPKPRPFLQSLRNAQKLPAVIAEIKKASPSKGIIRKDFNPRKIAKCYQRGGASCISVLTDKKFFQGGFEVLIEVRKSTDLPILCKDFIVTPYQIYQARSAGADAILLIASVLADQDLQYLSKVALSLGLDILVEAHDANELERILKIGTFDLVGINNRDLTSFKTDLATTEELLSKYGSQLRENNTILVSESGIYNRQDLDRVLNAGAQAVLVGESLMIQDDVTDALALLIG